MVWEVNKLPTWTKVSICLLTLFCNCDAWMAVRSSRHYHRHHRHRHRHHHRHPHPHPHRHHPSNFRTLTVATTTALFESKAESATTEWTTSKQYSSPSSSSSSSSSQSDSALSLTLEELATALGGKGRAAACWDCFRLGIDPVWYFGGKNMNEVEPHIYYDDDHHHHHHDDVTNNHKSKVRGWTRQQIKNEFASRCVGNPLGTRTLRMIRDKFGSIENNVATLSKLTICNDGTAKLLLKLHYDGLEVEAVIIPWDNRNKSTLCISSQVGCRQACTFCLTGRMGKLRSLSTSEILSQVYWASKICRVYDMYPLDNAVFMGMGEPADNVKSVTEAAISLTDRKMFQLAPRRVTISTIAPSPNAFEMLGRSNVTLAWSVHASDDELRRQLVPTTSHPMTELRDALIRTLQGRSKRLRHMMIEVTLLDEINDSTREARHLAKFCEPLLTQVDGIKLIVNLIPWNDIGATFGPALHYRQPSMERVLAFQKVLADCGILCYVRTTRGDDKNAACGMLATKTRLGP